MHADTIFTASKERNIISNLFINISVQSKRDLKNDYEQNYSCQKHTSLPL